MTSGHHLEGSCTQDRACNDSAVRCLRAKGRVQRIHGANGSVRFEGHGKTACLLQCQAHRRIRRLREVLVGRVLSDDLWKQRWSTETSTSEVKERQSTIAR